MKQYLICLDDGHGIFTAGKRTPILPDGLSSETGNFMHENEFNRAVVSKLEMHLKRCGFKTLLVAPTDEDTSLADRVNLANKNKADAYISIHANAHTGEWGIANGVEVLHYPNSVEGKKLASSIHKYLIMGTRQKDRGVKEQNLYVLRNTNMVSVLVEAGFMDNLEEAKLLLSDIFRNECAYEIARGICDYFKVDFMEELSPIQFYRVRTAWEDTVSQLGAFNSLNRATELAKQHEGYKVFNQYGVKVYPEESTMEQTNNQKEISELKDIIEKLEVDNLKLLAENEELKYQLSDLSTKVTNIKNILKIEEMIK